MRYAKVQGLQRLLQAEYDTGLSDRKAQTSVSSLLDFGMLGPEERSKNIANF